MAALALTGVWIAAAIFRIARLSPGPVDQWWNGVMTSSATPAAHAVAATLAVIGTGLPGSALAVVVGCLVGAVRGWVWGAFVVAASVISALDVAGMKALAMRTRPDPAFGLFNAFPSGHTANAALLGTVVLILIRQLAVRALAVAWIVAMAWSRTALHAHWLTDVLAAVVAGAATAVLLSAACRALLARRDRRRSVVDGVVHQETI